jgi:hypothetical protein
MTEVRKVVRIEHPGRATTDGEVPFVEGMVCTWVARVGGSHTDFTFVKRPAPICSNDLARAMMDGNADLYRDRERGK